MCSRHCKYCFGHEYLSIYLDEEKKGHVKKKQKWGYQISAAVNTNSFSPGFVFFGLGYYWQLKKLPPDTRCLGFGGEYLSTVHMGL